MVSNTHCPAVHILGSQNVKSRAEGMADHYWPWAVFLSELFFVCLSIWLSRSLYILVSPFPGFCLFWCLSLCFSLGICLSLCLPLCVSLFVLLSLFVYLTLSVSLCLSHLFRLALSALFCLSCFVFLALSVLLSLSRFVCFALSVSSCLSCFVCLTLPLSCFPYLLGAFPS